MIPLIVGATAVISAAPAFADEPDGVGYERTIVLRDGSAACSASMTADKYSGSFNPGKVSNRFLTDCRLTGPRTTTVTAGAIKN